MTMPSTSQLDSSTIRQLQQLQQFLLRQAGTETQSASNNQDSVKFNKNLLDFDYGDEEEEEKPPSPQVSSVIEVITVFFYKLLFVK